MQLSHLSMHHVFFQTKENQDNFLITVV